MDQVAGPYAGALVEVAKKTNSLEAVHADVDALAGVLKENEVRRRCGCCGFLPYRPRPRRCCSGRVGAAALLLFIAWVLRHAGSCSAAWCFRPSRF